MRLLRRLAMVLLVVSLGVTSVSAQEPIKAGKVSFAKAFRYAGDTFPKGRYEVILHPASDGDYVALVQDGKELLRELAITLEAKSSAKGARVSLSTLTRDGGRVRLAIRHGQATYLVFFEPVAP